MKYDREFRNDWGWAKEEQKRIRTEAELYRLAQHLGLLPARVTQPSIKCVIHAPAKQDSGFQKFMQLALAPVRLG